VSSSGKKRSPTWRRIKFAIIRRVIAPVLLVLVKLWMRTWRVRFEGEECLAEMHRADPPCAAAIFHGSFFSALGAFQSIPRARRPRIVTMVSPSQDGQLLGEIIASFGMETVNGSPRSRGAAGLLELIDAVRAGKLGLLAVDGPRGPRGVPREGVFTLASTTSARLYSVTTHSTSAMRFRSWDRAEFPLPFASVIVALEQVFDCSADKLPDGAAGLLQERMLVSMERLGADTTGIERLAKGDSAC
jgi:lysophospholipid acyltransferase (LPLAT)-like uncharacterized protein